MKKFVYSLVLLFSLAYLGKAGAATDPVPETNHGNDLTQADYGGYQVSVATFTAGMTTATVYGVSMGSETVRGVFQGINFSSGGIFTNDFVDVFDSTDANTATSMSRLGRWYNANTYTISGTTIAAGWVGPKAPIQFRKGLRWTSSSSQYNIISVFYRQLSGDRGQ